MDKQVIYNKIESLRRCIQRIKDKTPRNFEVLLEDYDLQDIICLNLERSVQICVDIAAHVIAESDAKAPDTMTDSFAELRKMEYIDQKTEERLRKAVGFRNVAVHAYKEIDWEIVYSIITVNLDDFIEFARQILARINVTE